MIAFDAETSVAVGHRGATRPTGRGRGWREVGYLWLPDRRLIPLSPADYLNLGRTGAQAIPAGSVAWLTERPHTWRAKVEAAILCQRGAIAFDAATGGSAAFATSITNAHTCTGSDRIINVMGVTRHGSTSFTGVTYAGSALSAVSGADAAGGSTGNPCNASGWALVAPATGANNVVSTQNDGNSSVSYHIIMSYTGVDQTTPTTGGMGLAGTSNDVTFAIDPDASGDWLVAAFVSSTANFHTYVVAGTTVTRINTSQHRVGGDEPATGTLSQNMGWTGNAASDPWRGVGWALKQAAGGGGGSPIRRRALLGVGI